MDFLFTDHKYSEILSLVKTFSGPYQKRSLNDTLFSCIKWNMIY